MTDHRAAAEALLAAAQAHPYAAVTRSALLAEAQVHALLALAPPSGLVIPEPAPTPEPEPEPEPAPPRAPRRRATKPTEPAK